MLLLLLLLVMLNALRQLRRGAKIISIKVQIIKSLAAGT